MIQLRFDAVRLQFDAILRPSNHSSIKVELYL